MASLLGFLWFLEIGGGRTLNPLTVDWIPGGDWMQHWLGWLMFRHEPWTFPLGTTSAMPYPIGTTIGFTDSNPIVSLLLKPFSGLMPAEVQFIGPWLALCFILQGYVGALLTSTVTDDEGQQLLGGYLFVLSPVLLARLGHDTLCAHWLLLLLLYLGLRAYPDGAAARRGILLAVGAVMLSAGIHPYLTAMCLLLALAIYVRLWRLRVVPLRTTVGAVFATAAGMLAVFGGIGYFSGAGMGSTGFGMFAADVLALVSPGPHSRLLPDPGLPWEGYGFLGIGGVVAVAVAFARFARHRPALRPAVWPVVGAAVLMGVYALSQEVRAAGHVVATLERLYAWFAPLVGPFRASGRFIWPFHYLVLLFGIWGVTRAFGSGRRAVSTTLLAVVVVLQVADLRVDAQWYAPKGFRRAPAAELSPAIGKYDNLALFPMQVLGVCGVPYEEEHAYRFMLLAYQLKMTYNSGIFARLPAGKIAAECTRLREVVESGHLDPRTVYVVSRPYLSLFHDAGAACGRFDGDWICVSRDSDAGFRRFVEAPK